LTFAAQVAEFGGTATSIDLNVDAADQVLGQNGLRRQVTLIPGHSIDVLAALLYESPMRFDLILLDSDNDPGLILHEYLIAKRLLRGDGIIVVDDVDPHSTTVMKGHALQPWLDEHGIEYHIQQREGNGFTTGMMVIG
jgi:predicted O-methyltransferase YrrM